MSRRLDGFEKAVTAVSRAQARLDKATNAYQAALRDRDQALLLAHLKGGTVRELGERFGLSPAAVSKAVRRSAEHERAAKLERASKEVK